MTEVIVIDPESLKTPLDTQTETAAKEAGKLKAAAHSPDTLLPGANFVGYTYDVVKGYMYPNNMSIGQYLFRPRAIDGADDWWEQTVSRRRWLVPRFCKVLSDQRAAISIQKGSSLQDYSRDIAGSVNLEGSYGFFESSLSASFSMSDSRLSQLHFSTLSDNYQFWSVHLLDSSYLRDFLSDAARNDIDKAPARDLFKRWGTHYINGVSVGARALVSNRTELLKLKSSKEMEAKLEMSYKFGIGQVSGGMESRYREASEEIRESSETKVEVIGGQATLGRQILEGKYDAWLETLEELAMPMSFTKDGLLPIWTLTQSPERQKELAAEFEKYKNDIELTYPARLPLREGDTLVIQADNEKYLVPRSGDAYKTLEPRGDITQAMRFHVTRVKEVRGTVYVLLKTNQDTGVSTFEHGIAAANSFETINTNDGMYWYALEEVPGNEGWYSIRSQSLFQGGKWWSRDPAGKRITLSNESPTTNFHSNFRFYLLSGP